MPTTLAQTVDLYQRAMASTQRVLNLLETPISIRHGDRALPKDFRGDVVIHSQAQADKYQCYRRILGSLTIVQPRMGTIRLPKLRAVQGDVRIVHRAGQHDQILSACVPELREIGGRVELERRPLGATDLTATVAADAR